MAWFRRKAKRPTEKLVDVAERLTVQRRRQADRDQATLSDRATVQGWLRALGQQGEQHVFINRQWGTVVAVADPRDDAIGVFLADGEQTWHAAPPGADSSVGLTLAQTSVS